MQPCVTYLCNFLLRMCSVYAVNDRTQCMWLMVSINKTRKVIQAYTCICRSPYHRLRHRPIHLKRSDIRWDHTELPAMHQTRAIPDFTPSTPTLPVQYHHLLVGTHFQAIAEGSRLSSHENTFISSSNDHRALITRLNTFCKNHFVFFTYFYRTVVLSMLSSKHFYLCIFFLLYP